MKGKYNVLEIAEYFLSLDDEKKFFDTNCVQKNNRTFYVGNARLNKFLHLVQLLYIAKEGTPLFKETIYAYDNGGIIKEIRANYSKIIKMPIRKEFSFTSEDKHFLMKFYNAFKNADLDELIEISHEDGEWKEKHEQHSFLELPMDLLSRENEYKNQYKDMLEVLGY